MEKRAVGEVNVQDKQHCDQRRRPSPESGNQRKTCENLAEKGQPDEYGGTGRFPTTA